jgi:hypothetical protein
VLTFAGGAGFGNDVFCDSETGHSCSATEPDKGKRKTHQLKPAGIRPHQRSERATEALGIFHVAADISSAEPIATLWDWTLAIGPPGKAWRPTARD